MGSQGIQGIQGIVGPSGESIVGPIGAMGPQGEPGAICDRFRQEYEDLKNAINMTVIDSYAERIEFNISTGTDRSWLFLIPKHNIVYEAHIIFTGDYVSISHSWYNETTRINLGGSGRSLVRKGYEEVSPYYGLQEFLWGTITVNYYYTLDTHPDLANKLKIGCAIVTNLPTIGGHRGTYIDIG